MPFYGDREILHQTFCGVETQLIVHETPLYAEKTTLHNMPLYVKMLICVAEMNVHRMLLLVVMPIYMTNIVFLETCSMALVDQPRRLAEALVRWRLHRDRAGRLRLWALALRKV